VRQFEPHEAEAVFASVERNRAYLREWLPWVDPTQSAQVVREFIHRSRVQYDNHQGPSCGIWMDGESIGSIGCHPIDWANRQAAIGYWIDPRHSGKGLVTQCCILLIDYLFDLGIHRVVIQCGTRNTKSCAIPRRLGFVREGVMREGQWVNDRWVDLEVWSMLEDEWRKRG